MLTLVPATHWGFADRGLVREGFAADLIVFDPDTISPELPEVVNDLPAGARRLVQRARGIAATIVNGEVLLRDRSEEHTSELQSQSNLVCRLLLEKKSHRHRAGSRRVGQRVVVGIDGLHPLGVSPLRQRRLLEAAVTHLALGAVAEAERALAVGAV